MKSLKVFKSMRFVINIFLKACVMCIDVFLEDQSIGRLVGVRLGTSQGDQSGITS